MSVGYRLADLDGRVRVMNDKVEETPPRKKTPKAADRQRPVAMPGRPHGTPYEGLRLVRAFCAIEDQNIRGALLEFVENLAGKSLV